MRKFSYFRQQGCIRFNLFQNLGVRIHMDRIDFRTAVEDGGVIHIPVEYEREIAKGEIVHVTLSAETRRTRLVERMINHPLHVDDATPLSREEIYDRRV